MSQDSSGDLGAFNVGSRVGKYLIEEQIGRGGMAAVFRARDAELGRVVALKILAPALAADEGFRQRFVRESRAAAAVDDPHIIPLYEAGQDGAVLFIAMRYVSGGDVRSLLFRQGSLTPEQVAGIVSASPRRSTRRMRAGWCTATSSRRTCCSTRRPAGPITCTCPISG